MSPEEIRDLLEKMNALQTSDGVSNIISASLIVDPIVSNKLAVELLQKVDRESKPISARKRLVLCLQCCSFSLDEIWNL